MKWFLIFMSIVSLQHAEQYVIVNLTEQMAYAIEDGEIMLEGRISSGKKGRETPEGEYTILQKKRHHKSNLWPKPKGGAKMPYMMRLTNTGIAMHLGYVPHYPASHGCIRLENGFAQDMFSWAKIGIQVFVEGSAFEESYEGYDDGYSIGNTYD
jgi:lipoprotein-anchoring transpeptidase ErfK/SrfK